MIVHARRASALLSMLVRTNGWTKPFVVPVNACPAVPASLLHGGGVFRFVDIAEEHWHLDLERTLELLRAAPEDYSGVIFIRPYGALVGDIELLGREMERISPRLLLIDDRCLSVPDVHQTEPDPASVVLYSTGYSKPVELDDGGFAVLASNVRAGELNGSYQAEDWDEEQAHWQRVVAGNETFRPPAGDWLDLRPPDLSLERYLERVQEQRRKAMANTARINEIYTEAIPAACCLPAEYQHWRFNIRVPNKEALLARIFKRGFFASSHYAPLPSGDHPVEAPVAEGLHREVVNLFNDHRVDEPFARAVATIVREHLHDAGLM